MARALLRGLIGRTLDLPAQEVEFSYGNHGKPALRRPGDSGLEFNLSHSNGLALIATTWGRAVGIADMVAFGIMYLIGALGVSTGYHRLLAHRAFKTSRPLKIFFATAGAIAGQGPPLIWVAHHRRHHRCQ